MSYKVILTILDNTKNSDARVQYAIGLAKQHNATLMGIAPKDLATSLYIGDFMSANSSLLVELQESIDKDAKDAIDSFRNICKESDFKSFKHKVFTGSAAAAITSEAPLCDLIVLTQHFKSAETTIDTEGLIEHSLQVSARPILIVPAVGEFTAPPINALIAWRDSRECSHAIRQSLPLLQNAENVEMVEVVKSIKSPKDKKYQHDGYLDYLQSHGVDASFSVKKSDIDAANFLLSYSCDAGADLLVMGGYGHARLREWALGGVTKTILETMTLPVLMAH